MEGHPTRVSFTRKMPTHLYENSNDLGVRSPDKWSVPLIPLETEVAPFGTQGQEDTALPTRSTFIPQHDKRDVYCTCATGKLRLELSIFLHRGENSTEKLL